MMRLYRCHARQRRPDPSTGDLIAAGRLREIGRLTAPAASGVAGVTRWRSNLRNAVLADLTATTTMLGRSRLPRWATA